MSKFVEYHTIEIRIPKNMLNTSKNGHVSVVPTLTKTGNPSKRAGKLSLVLKVSDDNKPHIIEEGRLITKDELKENSKKKVKKEKTDTMIKKLHEDHSNMTSKLKLIDFDEIKKKKAIKTKMKNVNQDLFLEWFFWHIHPFLDSVKWNSLTENEKYYYYRRYNAEHFNNLPLQKQWIDKQFGPNILIPKIELLKQAEDYIMSNPKSPKSWKYENSLELYHDKTGWGKLDSKIMSIYKPTEEDDEKKKQSYNLLYGDNNESGPEVRRPFGRRR